MGLGERLRRRALAKNELVGVTRMRFDGYRVALCGEGADELFCGYAPLELAFSQGGAGDNGEDGGGHSV